MTEVTIQTKDKPEHTLVHRIGNYYKHEDGTIVVLANVQGKAVLITSCGHFWTTPAEYGGSNSFWELTHDQFDACFGATGKFTLIPHITITEGEQV